MPIRGKPGILILDWGVEIGRAVIECQLIAAALRRKRCEQRVAVKGRP